MNSIEEKRKQIKELETEISLLEEKIEKIKWEIRNDSTPHKQLEIQFNYD